MSSGMIDRPKDNMKRKKDWIIHNQWENCDAHFMLWNFGINLIKVFSKTKKVMRGRQECLALWPVKGSKQDLGMWGKEWQEQILPNWMSNYSRHTTYMSLWDKER